MWAFFVFACFLNFSKNDFRKNNWEKAGSLSLVPIHVLAGRTTTRDASRCMDTNDHKGSQPSQQKRASSQQSCTC